MRRFWIHWLLTWTLITALQFDRLFAEEPVALPEDVLRLVDSQARYRPTPLPADEDGYRVLIELQKLRVVEPSIVNDREFTDVFRAVSAGEKKFPDGELAQRLNKVIDDNVDGLSLVDQFARFRGVRFPDVLKVSVSELRQFLWIRRLQIIQHQSQGKFEDATRWLFDDLHIAEMLEDSEGGLIAWLVGYSLEAGAYELMLRMAADPNCPIEQLESWQRRMLDARKRSLHSLSQCLRRDYFAVQLPPLAKLPPDATLEQAVAETVGRHRPPPERFAVNLRFTLREWQVLALLANHPTPFDRDETIRTSSQQVADVIRVLEFDRSRARDIDDDEIDRVATLWPESMGLDAFSVLQLHFGGPSWESWQAFWNEIVSAVEASEQLAEIPNVFGKYFIATYGDLSKADSLAVSVTRRRTRIEATTTSLAIRRFERLYLRTPKTLQELVDVKLLSELPRDPIDDQPLRYDPSRRILWSIGLDGQDDGGVQRFESSEKLFAMMRKLLPKQDAAKLPKVPNKRAETSPLASDIVYSVDGKDVLPPPNP
ncbi:MAG: hypothetical protein IAG10_28375 [Planctomycetaceae bacterium]|nr:hypothetical protein [Planctomycetaceae bacterium]